jgi:hypothetical protein
MQSDPRLKWIQENRRRTERVQRAAVPIQRLTQSMLAGAGAEGAKRVALAAADIVDDEFRAHCRIWSAEKGALIVHVDEPALVCPMRLRWSGPLREGLVSVKVGRLTHGIVFRYGEAGFRVTTGRDCERQRSGT